MVSLIPLSSLDPQKAPGRRVTALAGTKKERSAALKKSSQLLCLLALMFGLSLAASADTIWNIDATLQYNNTTNLITGSFTLNPSLNVVTYNIAVTGTNTQANKVYTPANSFPVNPTPTNFPFFSPATSQFLILYLVHPVTNAGGTIPLSVGSAGLSANSTIACPGCSTLVSGTVSALPIPEPSSLALLGSGVLGVATLLRRKFVR